MVPMRLALSATTLALVVLPTSAHAAGFETAVKHTAAPAAVKHTAVKHTSVKHTAVKHTSVQAAVKHTLSTAAAPADLALLGELGLLG